MLVLYNNGRWTIHELKHVLENIPGLKNNPGIIHYMYFIILFALLYKHVVYITLALFGEQKYYTRITHKR